MTRKHRFMLWPWGASARYRRREWLKIQAEYEEEALRYRDFISAVDDLAFGLSDNAEESVRDLAKEEVAIAIDWFCTELHEIDVPIPQDVYQRLTIAGLFLVGDEFSRWIKRLAPQVLPDDDIAFTEESKKRFRTEYVREPVLESGGAFRDLIEHYQVKFPQATDPHALARELQNDRLKKLEVMGVLRGMFDLSFDDAKNVVKAIESASEP